MISIILRGGLGNQLFQLFTCMSYGFDHKKQIILSTTKEDYVSPVDKISLRPTYWDTFLSKFQFLLVDKNDQRWSQFKIMYAEEDSYCPIPYHPANIMLNGYFQSYKYFHTHKSSVFSLLNLDVYKEQVLSKYDMPTDTLHISMHFRIGDYKQAGADIHPILHINYYSNSIQFIKNNIDSFSSQKVKIICFGEKTNKEEILTSIRFLSTMFPQIFFEFLEKDITDYEEMILMSLCQHNIIANSTFSWWGAYLNQNPTKIVSYPQTWFGPCIRKNTIDLCPPEWTCISSDI